MQKLLKLLPKPIHDALVWQLIKRSFLASQAGQDFWVFGEVFNEKRGGFYLDIGAHDGLSLSNTFLLEHKYGWQGICVEANPATYRDLVRNRRATCLNVCLDRAEGEVDFVLEGVLSGIAGAEGGVPPEPGSVVRIKTRPLASVLREHHAPQIIDYLSIDVEGAEERILTGPDVFTYTFRCLTIERPSPVVRDLLARHGYVLIKEIPGLDCFYLHESFLPEYQKNLPRFYDKTHVALQWR